MTLSSIFVLPAPPHPQARNTTARCYAALLSGMSRLDVASRVLAIDDGSGIAAKEWTASLPQTTLMTFEPDPARRDLARRLRRLRYPMFDAAPAALRARLSDEVAVGYDVLHVEDFYLGPLAATRPRTLLSVHHSEARDTRARKDDLRSALRQMHTLRAERLLLRAQRQLRTISPELEADVRHAGASAPVTVIPLSLKLDEYEFSPDGRPCTVGLIGSMRWPPTRAAALRLLKHVWPKVLRARPDAELVLAGWAADTLREAASDTSRVTIMSDLPDHRDFFDRVGLLAFPLAVGSGMKVKVLESMALGVPVVTTLAGTEGLRSGPEPGWYEGGGSATTFASAIVDALDDDAGRERRARCARHLLEEQCDADVVAKQLVALHARVMGTAE